MGSKFVPEKLVYKNRTLGTQVLVPALILPIHILKFEQVLYNYPTEVYWQAMQTLSILGPVVQSVVILTSLLVVKMLTVLVSTIPNSQVFLLKKCE